MVLISVHQMTSLVKTTNKMQNIAKYDSTIKTGRVSFNYKTIYGMYCAFGWMLYQK